MLLNYIKTRLSPGKFIALAFLMSLFVFGRSDNMISWGLGIGFLFFSFLVFRFIDDAGSVYYDREHHPDRDYLSGKYYPKFLLITGGIVAVYLIIIVLNLFFVWLVLLGFIVLTILLYFVFKHNNAILPIIPLLKYPVLVWAVAALNSTAIPFPVLFSTFLIMASYDVLETVYKKPLNLWMSLVLLFACGMLLFQPWGNYFNIIYVLGIFVAIPFLRCSAGLKNIPVLYFPIVFYILKSL
jgi:hypothetical protein